MSDLQKIIQEKKESKDFYTIRQGLLTERDCFEAIEALGNRIYVLKQEIEKKIKAGADPKQDQQLQAMAIAGEKVHQMQMQVVNDVCERFEVIHPMVEKPSDELLKLKQPYWNWYKDQYKKYYGRPAPEMV